MVPLGACRGQSPGKAVRDRQEPRARIPARRVIVSDASAPSVGQSPPARYPGVRPHSCCRAVLLPVPAERMGIMFQRFRSRNARRTSKLLVEQLEARCVPANFVPVLTTLGAHFTTSLGRTVQLTGTFQDTDVNDPHSV